MMRISSLGWLAVACGSLSIAAVHEARTTKKTATHQIQIDQQEKIDDFPDDQLMAINHPEDPDDMLKMQLHGWKLFLHLTSKAGAPLDHPDWRDWYAKCDLDMSPDCDDPTHGHNTFAGNSPQIGPASNRAGGHFSTVFYRPSVGNMIKGLKLADASGLQDILDKQLSGLPANPASIPAFDHESIVVKEIWQGFPTGTNVRKLAVLRLYDAADKKIKLNDGSISSIDFNWPSTNIKLKGNVVDRDTPCAATDYKAGEAIPINCFYWREYPDICKPVMEQPTLAGITSPLKSPCIVALVGVHIATKEIANWTWSTFWWTNRMTDVQANIPKEIRDAKAPSDLAIPAQYSHYAMNTTFGPPDGKDPAGDGRSVFNPYLEGPNSGGPQSNCFTCHERAAYNPRGRFDGKTITQHHSGQGIGPAGNELTWGPPRGPLTSQDCALMPDSTTPCRLQTDFLWSIATNQDENTSSPK